MRHYIFTLIAICYGFSAAAMQKAPWPAHDGKPSSSRKAYAENVVKQIEDKSSKLAFIPNKGQYENPDILYVAKTPLGHYTLTNQGLIIGVYDEESVRAIQEYAIQAEDRQTGDQYRQTHARPALKGTGILMKFAGAKTATLATTRQEGESKDYFNWLSSGKSIQGVHSYTTVSYQELYEGIDVKYYTAANGGIENDIIVKPGADASKVAMQIDGTRTVSVSDGKIELATAHGNIQMLEPVSWLLDAKGKKTAIKIGYKDLGNGKVGFNIPDYDHKKTLVIDPIVMRWSTWVNEDSDHTDGHNHGIDLDKEGNIYVTGYIDGSTTAALTTVGAYAPVAGGLAEQTFIGKYTEPSTPGGTGTRLWQTYLASDATGSNRANALLVGPDGNLYLAGDATSIMSEGYGSISASQPWTNADPGTSGHLTGYIAKVLPDGTGAAVRTIVGTDLSTHHLRFWDIRVMPGPSGTFSLVVVGENISNGPGADLPATVEIPGGGTKAYASFAVGLVLNIAPDLGTVNWFKSIAGTGGHNILAISTLDYANNIYVGGRSASTTGLVKNLTNQASKAASNQDGWLMKLSPAGEILWSRYINGVAGNTFTSTLCMELSRDGSHLILGGTTYGLAPVNITAGAYQTAFAGGGHDLFIQKVPLSGADPVWGTYLGSAGDETNMMGLGVDKNDEVYVLAYLDAAGATAFPVTSDRLQNNQTGPSEGVFAKLSSDGSSLLYSTTLGGSANDFDPLGQRGIKFADCRIYLAITSGSSTFPLTAGAISTTKVGGGFAPIIVSMANPPDFNPYTLTPSSQTTACNGTANDITASAITYNIPTIIRNNVAQTPGTPGAYPGGLPAPAGYQWQSSVDGGATWTNIAGATGLTLTSAQIGTVLQDTRYRIVVDGDACNRPLDPVAQINVSNGDPTATPSVQCSGGQGEIFANAAGPGPLTYAWSLPPGSTRGPQSGSSISLPGVNETDAGYYSVTVSSPSGCQTTRTFLFNPQTCALSALPVTLASFKASTEECGVQLEWTTTQEVNNAGFTIERSVNGTTFEEIEWTVGAGESSVLKSYSYYDGQVAPLQIYYYRLRQVDLDGKVAYSRVVAAKPWCGQPIPQVVVYPNPARDQFTLSGLNGGENVSIVSLSGNLVFHGVAMEDQLKINTRFFQPGVYIIRVAFNNGLTVSRKLLKQ
jgi:hypothetical protein